MVVENRDKAYFHLQQHFTLGVKRGSTRNHLDISVNMGFQECMPNFGSKCLYTRGLISTLYCIVITIVYKHSFCDRYGLLVRKGMSHTATNGWFLKKVTWLKGSGAQYQKSWPGLSLSAITPVMAENAWFSLNATNEIVCSWENSPTK